MAGVKGKDIDQSIQGDVITALDGNQIMNTHELLSYIENNKLIGQEITITLYRSNQTTNLTAVLGERPLPLYTSPFISSQMPLF